MNGEILFWNELLDCAFELSSMGIRVDPESLDRQLTIAGCDDRRERTYHKMLLAGQLPPTIGGRHWPVAPVHAAAWQGAHWRGAGVRLGRRDDRRL